MSKYILQGFMVGLAYVAPIGMQNIYVINSAMANKRARAYSISAMWKNPSRSWHLRVFL